MSSSKVLVRANVLMGLLPPIGPHAEWQAAVAFLRLAQNTELNVKNSTLNFIDTDKRLLGTCESAFGLTPGTRLRGPYTVKLSDGRRRPARAVHQRWDLNEMSVATGMGTRETESQPFQVVYLPLQVALPHDYHVIASLVNQGQTPLDIAEGVRQAVCWMDGIPFESNAGRVWNGPYLVRPNRATRYYFRLSDFPGMPRSGLHEMSLEMCGLRSHAEIVDWHGEPWVEHLASS